MDQGDRGRDHPKPEQGGSDGNDLCLLWAPVRHTVGYPHRHPGHQKTGSDPGGTDRRHLHERMAQAQLALRRPHHRRPALRRPMAAHGVLVRLG